MVIVLHVPVNGTSVLARILSRASGRDVTTAKHDSPLEAGHIVVAPPDYHLLVNDDRLELAHVARVNGHRPAIDPLFFSAARWRGPRAIGVVLSGMLDDGSAGMRAILRSGGRGLAQDPAEALYPDMPMHALQAAPACEKIALSQMGARLAELVSEGTAVRRGDLTLEERMETEHDMESTKHPSTEGEPSAFSCPDCHGVLWELKDGELVRYRCRVGHAFSEASLAHLQDETLETALWTAYRALRESAGLSTRLANRARAQGQTGTEKAYRTRAQDSNAKADSIEKVLGRDPFAQPSTSER